MKNDDKLGKLSSAAMEKLSSSIKAPIPDSPGDCHTFAFHDNAGAIKKLEHTSSVLKSICFPTIIFFQLQ